MTPQVPAAGQPDTTAEGEPGGRAQRHIASLIVALIAGMVVVVVLAIFLATSLAGPRPDDGSEPSTDRSPRDPAASSIATGSPRGGSSSSSPSRARPLVIDQIVDPPLCATFHGTGDVPQGRTLWLAVVSDERKYYFFPTEPDPMQGRWTAANVTLGVPEEKPGEPFTVIAVLADSAGDREIENAGWVGLRHLPAKGTVESHRIYVRRGADEQACQE